MTLAGLGVAVGQKMSRAPVYFTIMQARFNTVFALDSYAAPIQESLRKQGFPDANRGSLARLSLNLTPQAEGAAPQLPVSQIARYTFLDMRGTSGFILDEGSLTFQTTEYDVFETFSASFLKGLQSVHEIIGLSYTDRIGFRYLDAVYPQLGEQLSDYLRPSVLGLSERPSATLGHSFSETLLKMKDVSVVARVIVQDGQVGFPPDLLPNQLKLGERFQLLNGRHAIIDIDGFAEVRAAFDSDYIKGRLVEIHDAIHEAFCETVTDKALLAWK